MPWHGRFPRFEKRPRALVWSALLVIALIMAACEAGTTSENGATRSSTMEVTNTAPEPAPTPEKRAGVFFPHSSQPEGSVTDAVTTGRQVVEGECFRVRYSRSNNNVIVFPYGFSPTRKHGEIHILNKEGEDVARVGDTIRMGGGEISFGEAGGTPKEARRNFEAARKETGVPDQCRGTLWMAWYVKAVGEKNREK